MKTADLEADIGDVLLTEEQIQARVIELGTAITADSAGRPLTLVSVLKGSILFMADLMRAIRAPLKIELMEVSSYRGATTEPSRLARRLTDLSSRIAGTDVTLPYDII